MYNHNISYLSIESVIDDLKKFLSDFTITMTPEIENKIRELYPNDIAIENYILTLVVNYLEKL